MARSKFRRSLRFENLESRQLLSSGGPTAQQQYMLQLLNEARTNPPAAAQQISNNITPDVQATINYYGVNLPATLQRISSATPQPPLAWNNALASAAQAHSQDMANTQVQSHTGSDGSTPQQRMQQSGYGSPASTGENAYAYATSAEQAMQAFLIDWGVASDGHRVNIQQPGVPAQNAYRDAGIGLVNSNNSSFGPLVVTQDFASQPNEQAQLVGVAYNDNYGSGFFQQGEGQGGIQIDAVNTQTGAVSSTQTWSAGGYELPLAPGQYLVIASLNDQVIQTANITINNVNVEQDFILSNHWQGGTRENAIAAAQPQVNNQPAVSQPYAAQPQVNNQPAVSQPYAVGASIALPAISQSSAPAASQSSAPAAPAGAWSWSTWNAQVS
jgi:hypothetical protein